MTVYAAFPRIASCLAVTTVMTVLLSSQLHVVDSIIPPGSLLLNIRDSGGDGSNINGGSSKLSTLNQFGASNTNNGTVEDYAAVMKMKDTQEPVNNKDDKDLDETNGRKRKDDRNMENKEDDKEQQSSSSSSSSSVEEHTHDEKSGTTVDDPAVVGVKKHGSNKKSNAVGDPDGDDDDDDDDDNFSEYSEDWDDSVGDEPLEQEQQLQFEVEVVEQGDENEEESGTESTLESGADDENGGSVSGGGVGIRLGRMSSRGNAKNAKWKSKQLSHDQTRLLQAWIPHLYFPPTQQALAYLESNARLLDAASKSRLDRRTLYAGLLLEWGCTSQKLSTASRKFLPYQASQALQAALSMATQPQWRIFSQGSSGIRLYQDAGTGKPSTLGMQETIAMALVSTITCMVFKIVRRLKKSDR